MKKLIATVNAGLFLFDPERSTFYMAKDRGGEVYVYQQKPELDGSCWTGGEDYCKVSNYFPRLAELLNDVDYENSLRIISYNFDSETISVYKEITRPYIAEDEVVYLIRDGITDYSRKYHFKQWADDGRADVWFNGRSSETALNEDDFCTVDNVERA